MLKFNLYLKKLMFKEKKNEEKDPDKTGQI